MRSSAFSRGSQLCVLLSSARWRGVDCTVITKYARSQRYKILAQSCNFRRRLIACRRRYTETVYRAECQIDRLLRPRGVRHVLCRQRRASALAEVNLYRPIIWQLYIVARSCCCCCWCCCCCRGTVFAMHKHVNVSTLHVSADTV